MGMNKKYTIEDVKEILKKHKEFYVRIHEEARSDNAFIIDMSISFGGYTLPCFVNTENDVTVCRIDDFSYDLENDITYPVIEKDGNKFIKIDLDFIRSYIMLYDVDDSGNIIDIEFEEGFADELSLGTIRLSV